ncbi:MAG: hypothetical protein ABWZ80_05255 [Beijerinckiaceae bacterium]
MIDIRAYAIVSADDRIADEAGKLPDSLVCEADWLYFQAELDRCDYTVLGRASHEAAPNLRKRKRVVMTSRARGVERRADAIWWNPADVAWRDLARELMPGGGRVGVPGGQKAFDYFLDHGLTRFHLSRARQALLPGGRGLFAAVESGERVDDILTRNGFSAGEAELIDGDADVTLTIWRRPQAGDA